MIICNTHPPLSLGPICTILSGFILDCPAAKLPTAGSGGVLHSHYILQAVVFVFLFTKIA